MNDNKRGGTSLERESYGHGVKQGSYPSNAAVTTVPTTWEQHRGKQILVSAEWPEGANHRLEVDVRKKSNNWKDDNLTLKRLRMEENRVDIKKSGQADENVELEKESTTNAHWTSPVSPVYFTYSLLTAKMRDHRKTLSVEYLDL